MSETLTLPFSRRRFEESLIFRVLTDAKLHGELVAHPKEVYEREVGREIPEGVEIRVLEETGNIFYVVVPFVPRELKLTERQLLAIARRELTHRAPCWGLGDGLE